MEQKQRVGEGERVKGSGKEKQDTQLTAEAVTMSGSAPSMLVYG